MVVVGNTAMHHILLGLNPQHLATSPYTPVISKQVTLRPGDLGLSMYDHGRIQVLPNLAGFIGSDCLSGVYATGVYQSEEPCFFIDIGTNTEIVIGYKERMAACSCASGPAFEGYNIKHGIRARDLAIEKVEIDKETFEPTVETIGGEKPVGICGSGMIDALAEMLRTGIIDEKGRIQKISHPRIRKNSGPIEYVLVWKDETAIDQDITLTQKDIRELQKAKAAITAGASILFQTINLAPENILKAYIAGAFGSYLNQQNAKKIGLLPDIDDSKCIEVGNSAGAGAQMALISVDARKEIQNIASQIKYVELAGEPNFTKVYMKSLNLSKFEIK
jgi:uncharacterized 2Fe-2S/4Fe-4S cluster protein (DUF4445 family)